MRQIRQTLFTDGSAGEECGNCFATCLACMLERDLDTVPNFVHLYGDQFFAGANLWLEQEGYPFVLFPVHPTSASESGLLYIGAGMGVRGYHHACIFRGDALVWDPHPADAGLETIDLGMIFATRDPWVVR